MEHTDKFACSHREAGSRGERFTTDRDLSKIAHIVQRFKDGTTHATCESAIRDMRAWIIEMEDVTVTPGTQQMIVSSQVVPALTMLLAPEDAVTRRAKRLPGYIEEELTVLQRKWDRGDYSGSTTRGLLEVTTEDVNGIPKYKRLRVDKNWPFYRPGLYFGAGDLVNGQIWESRVELQRDGVHAPSIAGISGAADTGAYSIVLGAFDEKKNLGYADIDMGNVIEYMGTALPNENGLGPTNVKDSHMSIPGAWDPYSPVRPTVATRAMFTSLDKKTPVRVIRSWKMCSIVKNKPRKGYRYDGLYEVVKATAMKEARQIWSFRLHRLPVELPHQGELRGFSSVQQHPDSSGRRVGHFHKP